MKLRTLLVVALALTVVGLMTWGAIRVARDVTAPNASLTPTARVRRGTVGITVTARGTLQGGSPETLVVPMVATDSLAITFLRQPGEMVKEGDAVAQFDTTQLEYNLSEAEADLAEAQQKNIQTEADNQASDEETRQAVEAARTEVKLAELEVGKNETLSRTQARDNEIALEAARNRLRQAEQDLTNKKLSTAAGLAIQKAAEMRARMTADMARKNIESMTLKAKTAGYVNLMSNTFGIMVLTSGMTLPLVRLGDSVRPGMSVAQVFDLENWEAVAMVPELDRGHLEVGQPVSVSVVALAGKTYPGRVKSLGSPSGQAWERQFECRIALDQPGPELRPGMSLNLTITAGKLDDVLWVPSQALFERDGRSFVYARGAGGFTARDVTLVKRTESQVVLTGVNEGDEVALSSPSEQAQPTRTQQGAMKAIPK